MKESLLSITTPRYLYSLTMGYPWYSLLFFSFLLLILWYIMADFFLLIIIWLACVHSSAIVIAIFSFLFVRPTIARSSANANTSNPYSSSSLSKSLNIIRNSVGDSTPPCMTPWPILIFLPFALNTVYLYSHSIDYIRSSDIFRSLIFLNSISWFTVSKADLRSINRVQSLLFLLFYILFLRVSVILKMLSSQLIPYLKPVWLILSFHFPLAFNSSTSLVFNIVSNNL